MRARPRTPGGTTPSRLDDDAAGSRRARTSDPHTKADRSGRPRFR